MTPQVFETDCTRLTVFPAFVFCEVLDGPISLDEGTEILGERVPGVAVAFPTRNYGMQFKRFGIGFYDDGSPFTYALASTLSDSDNGPAPTLAAAQIGDEVALAGKLYTIAKAPNDNIELICPLD